MVLVPAAAFGHEYAAAHSGATYFGTLLEIDEDETTADEWVWVVDYGRREGGKTSMSEQYFMKPPATTPPPRAKRGKRRRSSNGYRTDDSDDDDDASPRAAPRIRFTSRARGAVFSFLGNVCVGVMLFGCPTRPARRPRRRGGRCGGSSWTGKPDMFVSISSLRRAAPWRF